MMNDGQWLLILETRGLSLARMSPIEQSKDLQHALLNTHKEQGMWRAMQQKPCYVLNCCLLCSTDNEGWEKLEVYPCKWALLWRSAGVDQWRRKPICTWYIILHWALRKVIFQWISQTLCRGSLIINVSEPDIFISSPTAFGLQFPIWMAFLFYFDVL